MRTGRAATVMTLTVLVAVTLSGCSATGEAVTAPAPSWKSGFAWSYAYENEWSYDWDEDGESDNFTETDNGRYIRQVMNTTQTAGDEPVYILVHQDTERRSARLEALSQIDLESMAYGFSYNYDCSADTCTGTIDMEYWDDDEIEWPPYLDFPLQTGKRWGAVVDLSEYDDGDFSITIAAVVEGAAVVDLPMGPTKTAKVNIIWRPTNMAEFEQAIRDEAAQEGYALDALDIVFESRETIYYSPDYQAIVKRDAFDSEKSYARGTDPEGEPFEFRFEGYDRNSMILDGARLAPAPEVAINDLVPYLAGKATLVDPLNETVVTSTYTVDVTPAKAVVNAGAGEAASFAATLDGAEALPEGHTLHWKAVDRDGRVLQTGTGAAFKPAIDEPGIFSVSVEARQGKSVVSGDTAMLTANWIASTTLACSEATVLGVPSCDIGQIPMAPGITSLTVRAVPTGALGALPGTSMQVRDSYGQAITGTADGDGYKVDMTDFSAYLIDGTDWTMQYRHSVGVLSDVEMDVEALYGEVSTVSVSMGEGARTPMPRLLERMPW